MTRWEGDIVTSTLALLVAAALGAALIAATGSVWLGMLTAAVIAAVWVGLAQPRLARRARSHSDAHRPTPDERYIRH